MKLHIVLLLLLFTNLSFAQMRLLSGPDQGAYYTFAEDINRVLSDSTTTPFSNIKTDGAAYNFEVLVAPLSEYKIAFMQMDYLYFMQGRDAQNNTEKTKPLKVLVPMAMEEIHLVTKKSTGLTKLSDLSTKGVVCIGSQEQATYATANYINEKANFNWSARNYHFDEALKYLVLGDIDVFIFVGSAPIKKLDIAPQGLNDELVLMQVDDVKGWAKNYTPSTIPANTYKWQKDDVSTYGVQTVLLVNEDKLTDEDKVFLKKIVNDMKANKENLLKGGHPEWANIDFDKWDTKNWPRLDLE